MKLKEVLRPIDDNVSVALTTRQFIKEYYKNKNAKFETDFKDVLECPKKDISFKQIQDYLDKEVIYINLMKSTFAKKDGYSIEIWIKLEDKIIGEEYK